MGFRLCLVVCLSGCGLVLDLDEAMDASARDVPGADTTVDERDSGLPSDGGLDAGRDAAELDADLPDGGEVDGNDPVDAALDAPLNGCSPACDVAQACSGGLCVPLCGDIACFDGQVCVDGVCGAVCDQDTCPSGQRCGGEGACVCNERPCGGEELCTPAGRCEILECDGSEDCTDPVGAGCTTFTCADNMCISSSNPFDECEYCDPLTGHVQFFDRDGDGFVRCSDGSCNEDPTTCDCNDDNPFVNPDAIDVFGQNRNCDDTTDPIVPLFCVIDRDGDEASVVEPAWGCPREMLVSARSLGEAVASLPRLDCNDMEPSIFPQQTQFFDEPIGGALGCAPARGECFDYNCDGRHERRYPAFARCFRASTQVECRRSKGWETDVAGGSGGVPACGAPGSFVTCEWIPEEETCSPSEATEGIQTCR